MLFAAGMNGYDEVWKFLGAAVGTAVRMKAEGMRFALILTAMENRPGSMLRCSVLPSTA